MSSSPPAKRTKRSPSAELPSGTPPRIDYFNPSPKYISFVEERSLQTDSSPIRVHLLCETERIASVPSLKRLAFNESDKELSRIALDASTANDFYYVYCVRKRTKLGNNTTYTRTLSAKYDDYLTLLLNTKTRNSFQRCMLAASHADAVLALANAAHKMLVSESSIFGWNLGTLSELLALRVAKNANFESFLFIYEQEKAKEEAARLVLDELLELVGMFEASIDRFADFLLHLGLFPIMSIDYVLQNSIMKLVCKKSSVLNYADFRDGNLLFGLRHYDSFSGVELRKDLLGTHDYTTYLFMLFRILDEKEPIYVKSLLSDELCAPLVRFLSTEGISLAQLCARFSSFVRIDENDVLYIEYMDDYQRRQRAYRWGVFLWEYLGDVEMSVTIGECDLRSIFTYSVYERSFFYAFPDFESFLNGAYEMDWLDRFALSARFKSYFRRIVAAFNYLQERVTPQQTCHITDIVLDHAYIMHGCDRQDFFEELLDSFIWWKASECRVDEVDNEPDKKAEVMELLGLDDLKSDDFELKMICLNVQVHPKCLLNSIEEIVFDWDSDDERRECLQCFGVELEQSTLHATVAERFDLAVAYIGQKLRSFVNAFNAVQDLLRELSKECEFFYVSMSVMTKLQSTLSAFYSNSFSRSEERTEVHLNAILCYLRKSIEFLRQQRGRVLRIGYYDELLPLLTILRRHSFYKFLIGTLNRSIDDNENYVIETPLYITDFLMQFLRRWRLFSNATLSLYDLDERTLLSNCLRVGMTRQASHLVDYIVNGPRVYAVHDDSVDLFARLSHWEHAYMIDTWGIGQASILPEISASFGATYYALFLRKILT